MREDYHADTAEHEPGLSLRQRAARVALARRRWLERATEGADRFEQRHLRAEFAAAKRELREALA